MEFRRVLLRVVFCFFFKQKTAYEMRISDWSSDVCSSDLHRGGYNQLQPLGGRDQLLEGAPVTDPVSWRDFHIGINLLAQLLDERAEIPAANIGGHHHPQLAVLAADLVKIGRAHV